MNSIVIIIKVVKVRKLRYLGNKTRLLENIDDFIKENAISGSTFCDIFSGTGAVSDYFKDKFTIYANDYLFYAKILTKAKIDNSNIPDFNLFFDKYKRSPFEYFNKKKYKFKDIFFITRNYTPMADRKFLTTENAIRVDGIRIDIENLNRKELLLENEYYYLIASLIESVTKFSNTSGTYEAFLKDWDPRAIKRFVIQPLNMKVVDSVSNNFSFSKDANELIRELSGDILYIDPPYTVTEYSSAYHLLETIARYDYPEIAGITARRQNNRKLSQYTRKNALDSFEDLVRQSDFTHIIVSYSNESIIKAEDLFVMLKKYAVNRQIVVKKLAYRAYKNLRESKKSKGLNELLIYIKKDSEVIKSPLNYSGSKNYIINEIRRVLPGKITDFVDVMGGAFNVGVNIVADKVTYNEINPFVFNLIKYNLEVDKDVIIRNSESIIRKYSIDNSKQEEFNKLRNDYNQNKNIELLFVISMFCFQNQLRFNNRMEFNTPVGNCGYNSSLTYRIRKFIPKTENVIFSNLDFIDYPYHQHDKESVFYFDPPYIITNASYNDGRRGFKGWTKLLESELLFLLIDLNTKGYKFILSNVIEHRGKVNNQLLEWIETHDFKIYRIDNTKRKEVLITNFNPIRGVR